MFPRWCLVAVAALVAGFSTPALAGDDDWVVLPAEGRDFERGREIVRLKDNLGKFREIKIMAIGGSLEIDNITIRGGSRDSGRENSTYRINERLGPNQSTKPIRLQDERTTVRSIEFDYGRAVDGARGRSVRPQIFGLVGPDTDGFDVLASRRVNRDEILLPVGEDDRPVGKLRFRVWEGPMFIRAAEIVFNNGERQEIRVRERMEPGDATDIIDVDGRNRRIKHVRIALRQRSGDVGRIDVLGIRVAKDYWAGRGDDRGRDGRDDRGRDGPRDAGPRDAGRGDDPWRDARRIASRDREAGRGWDLLGTSTAAMLSTDRDIIEVGRREGRFSAIRVRATKADVRMYSVVLVYGNGEREEVPIDGTLAAGEITEPFDLRGRGRAIERIEFRYKTKLNFRGSANVEVWGRQDERRDEDRRGEGRRDDDRRGEGRRDDDRRGEGRRDDDRRGDGPRGDRRYDDRPPAR